MYVRYATVGHGFPKFLATVRTHPDRCTFSKTDQDDSLALLKNYSCTVPRFSQQICSVQKQRARYPVCLSSLRIYFSFFGAIIARYYEHDDSFTESKNKLATGSGSPGEEFRFSKFYKFSETFPVHASPLCKNTHLECALQIYSCCRISPLTAYGHVVYIYGVYDIFLRKNISRGPVFELSTKNNNSKTRPRSTLLQMKISFRMT